MDLSKLPAKSSRAFAQSAAGAYVRTVPQTTSDPAAASFDIGFPPQTFTDESAGGTPPSGRDFNGILAHLSAWTRWQAAGGPVFFDNTFSNAIGGYPQGTRLTSTVTAGLFWVSTVDNNTGNPDSGAPNWLADGVATKGSNSNGYWRREADGSLRQWGTSLTPSLPNGGSFNWTATLPLPFPVAMTGANATLGNGGVGTGSAVTVMDVGTPFTFTGDTRLPAANATQISGFVQNNSTFATRMLIRWECFGE
jgi:hypothetical protein